MKTGSILAKASSVMFRDLGRYPSSKGKRKVKANIHENFQS